MTSSLPRRGIVRQTEGVSSLVLDAGPSPTPVGDEAELKEAFGGEETSTVSKAAAETSKVGGEASETSAAPSAGGSAVAATNGTAEPDTAKDGAAGKTALVGSVMGLVGMVMVWVL